MKTKISIIILIVSITFSCQSKTEIPHIEVIKTNLPIRLASIDFENKKKIAQISDRKKSKIKEVIKKYYFENCGGNKESLYTMKDVYFHTIEIKNKSNQILYWVIFKHISGKLNSKILFFDHTKNEFVKYQHNFNIHALYDEIDGKLEPTNLKKQLQIDHPEIEMLDFDGDKFVDFKLKRLYHNGTANAIEEMLIEVKETSVDTLKLERKWIRN